MELDTKRELFREAEVSKGYYYTGNPAEFERFRRFFRKNYTRFLPQDRNAKILDIGCGTGHFLYFLRSAGYTNLEGVELSAGNAEYCRRSGFRVAEADACDFLRRAAEPYDCIVMNDVLEHFTKTQMVTLLRLVHSRLADTGSLIAKVPNMANFITAPRARYVDFSHEIGFVPRSLTDALKLGGFAHAQVFPVDIYVHRLFLLNWAAKTAACVLHKMMHLCFLLYGIPTEHIFTKNILAVARKQPGDRLREAPSAAHCKA